LLEFYQNNKINKEKNNVFNISLIGGWSFELLYERSDFEYLKALLEFKNVIDCLSVPTFKWFNPYAIRIKHHDGKSIFNTDLTEAYNQHWADRYTNSFFGSYTYNNKYIRKVLPLEDGFVSHFRDTEIKAPNITIKLKDLIIDMEFFYYLIDIRGDFKLNMSCFEKCNH